MKAINPVAITDSILTSSNVTEADYSNYSSGTTYDAGDYVQITTSVHKIYLSMKNANLNHYPPDNTSGDDPWWVEVGYTNRWKMFDYVIQSQTQNSSTITVVLTPGVSIDSIAFLNIDASSIDISMTDPVEGLVYHDVVLLEAPETVLWELGTVWSSGEAWQGGSYEDLIEKVAMRSDLPNYPNAVLTIIISSSGENAKCGVLLIGNMTTLGSTKYNPNIGITDYSIKEADSYGNYVVLERAFSKRVECEFFMDTSDHVRVYRFLVHYRASALLWILNETYNTTILYGFYKDFSIVIQDLTMSICNISIEGLS